MIAYYPADYYTTPQGLAVESKGASRESARNWRLIKDLVRKYHNPGKFVTFAGYEWTGDRTRWGDVNVFHFGDDGELDLSDSLPELHEHFRGRKVLVIPHHTAYFPCQRGKDWSCHDEALSPVTEIYSIGILSAGSAFNMTVWSYVDQVDISILSDDQTFDDVHEATDAMVHGLAEIRRAAGLSGELSAVATAMAPATAN